MYSRLQLFQKFLRYYITAFNGKGHGMHSPFVFDFIINVLNDTTKYPVYDQVESLRRQLINDHSVVEVQDFGAGSSVDKTNQRSVSSIAKNAAKPAKYGQLLYRIVRYYQPKMILELGTSLGITTSYLAMGKKDASVITMEGANTIAAKARQSFGALQLQNITIKEGNFDETLSTVLSSLTAIDFIFIDGNHRREPTERYFQQLLPVLKNDSIIIFDDIHWSHEMEQAWHSIQQHPDVRCTIDLFFIGIVLLRKEFKEKQHFSIRF